MKTRWDNGYEHTLQPVEHYTNGTVQCLGIDYGRENPSWVQGRGPVTIRGEIALMFWIKFIELFPVNNFLNYSLWWGLCCQCPYPRLLWLSLSSLNIFWNGTKEKMKNKKNWKMICFTIMTEFKRESEEAWVPSLLLSQASFVYSFLTPHQPPLSLQSLGLLSSIAQCHLLKNPLKCFPMVILFLCHLCCWEIKFPGAIRVYWASKSLSVKW